MNCIEIGGFKKEKGNISGLILEILKSGQEQETIRKALGVLPELFKIESVTIQDCNFNVNEDGQDENCAEENNSY